MPPHTMLNNIYCNNGGHGQPRSTPSEFTWSPENRRVARQKFGFTSSADAPQTTQTPRKVRLTAARILQDYTEYHPPLVLPSYFYDVDPMQLVQSVVHKQPDIDWIPNFLKYSERVKRNKLKRRFHGEQGLPNGYPRMVNSASVWSNADMQGREDKYIFHLTPEDINEIEIAMKLYKVSSQSVSLIDRKTFPLPTLGPKITKIAVQLDYGCGFFVLRGIEPRKYSSEENVILYAGVASYVADRRGRQDENGNMLLHLVDLGSKVAPDNVRQAPYSNVAQPFHTDLGEIIGLYALEQAARGGKSKLASMGQVYNELAALRPDHIHTLHKPDWVFDRFGQDPPYLTRPLLYNDTEANNITLAFSRRLLTGSKVSPRSKDIPPMTEEQAEALDAVHFTAEKHCITLECRRGDMQFWNNLSLLHAREGFKDEPEKGMRRHLLRLWLRKEDSPWRSPPPLEGLLEEVYGDIQPGSSAKENWPITPILDYEHVTTRKRSSGHG